MFLTKNTSKILASISVILNVTAMFADSFSGRIGADAVIIRVTAIQFGFLTLLSAIFVDMNFFRNEYFNDRVIDSRILKKEPILLEKLIQISDIYFDSLLRGNSAKDKLIKEQVKNRLKKYVDDLRKVSEGKIKLNGTKRINLVIDLIKQADATVYAISYGDISSWWKGSVGRKFFEENKRIISLGIPIKRIFILSKTDRDIESMRDIITEQIQSGIEVCIAMREDIRDLGMNLLVCDNFFTSWTTISSDGYDTEGYISLNEDDIRDKKGRFEKIEERRIKETEFRDLLSP